MRVTRIQLERLIDRNKKFVVEHHHHKIVGRSSWDGAPQWQWRSVPVDRLTAYRYAAHIPDGRVVYVSAHEGTLYLHSHGSGGYFKSSRDGRYMDWIWTPGKTY